MRADPARLERVMAGGESQVRPLVCSFAPAFLCALEEEDPFAAWWEQEGAARALARAAHLVQPDGLVVHRGGVEPGLRDQATKVEAGPDGCRVSWADGTSTELTTLGGERRYGEGGSCGPPRMEQVDPAALHYWDEGRLFGPGPFAPWRTAVVTDLANRLQGQVALHGRVLSPFTQLMGYLGYEQTLFALVGEQDLARECLDRFTAGAVELGNRLLAAGAQALVLASPLSGADRLSRRLHREWVLPVERECIGRLSREGGAPIYLEGPLLAADRLDQLLATGAAGIGGVAAPPAGDLDLGRDLAFCAGRAFLMGGLDPEGDLLQGGPVRLERRLEELATLPGEGFILAPCRPLPAGVPRQHLELLARRGSWRD